MFKTRIVIIGLGRLGQELIGRLPRDYSITCLSTEDNATDILKTILKREDAELIQGDSSSRLVLKQARVEEADAVIITTTQDEEFNLEVARLLTGQFKTKRVISVAFSEEVSAQLTALGVEVEDIYGSSSLGMRNLIESRTRATHSIGLGKEEILEVEIHPHSRFANKPTAFLKPIKWRIGIIYREGNIIVPRPDTILKPKDRVVILGEPAVLKNVAEAMMFTYSKFPLEYGDTLVALFTGRESESYLDEIKHVYSTFPFKKAYFLLTGSSNIKQRMSRIESLDINNSTTRESGMPPHSALADVFAEISNAQGLVALPEISSRSSRMTLIRKLMASAKCPVLLCKGTFPYQRVAVPCIDRPETNAAIEALETALQLSEDLANEITAIFALPSAYLSDDLALIRDEELRKAVSSTALVYKQKVLNRDLKGNPVKSVMGVLRDYNLLSATLSSKERGFIPEFFDPDATAAIIARSPISSLVTPPWQESL